jgi:hypothetical protein
MIIILSIFGCFIFVVVILILTTMNLDSDKDEATQIIQHFRTKDRIESDRMLRNTMFQEQENKRELINYLLEVNEYTGISKRN